jgi:hypothetical protein
MKIGAAEVFVDDQANASDFDTAVLSVHEQVDAGSSDPPRWLTVLSREDPDGRDVAERGAGRFVSEPSRMRHGATDAVFEDACGNLPNLYRD